MVSRKRNGSNPHYLHGVLVGLKERLGGIEDTQKEILRQQVRSMLQFSGVNGKIDAHIASVHGVQLPVVAQPPIPVPAPTPAPVVVAANEEEKTDKAVGRTVRWIGSLIGVHWKTATVVTIIGLLTSYVGSCYGRQPVKQNNSISGPVQAAPVQSPHTHRIIPSNVVKPNNLEGGKKK